jgi:dipeptidyl-peptidase 4
MKYFIKPVVLFLIATLPAFAQQKIALNEIWRGTFSTEGMDELKAMSKTNRYAVLNPAGGGQTIDIYDYATLQKTGTALSSKDFTELKGGIHYYAFSPDETKILIGTGYERIYRRSFLSQFYVYDTAAKTLSKVAGDKTQKPAWSANSAKLAYGYNNNLYVYDVATKATTQLTADGQKNTVINGIADWVYEEEFGIVKAFDWNKTADKVAYIRFDETAVPEFTMEVYNKGLYPSPDTFKYPKAGEKNATVSLHIYDLETGQDKTIALGGYTDFYIPRLKWTNDAGILSVQVINRHQNSLDLIFIDAATGTAKVVLNEKDEAYVDVTDNLTFLNDNSFIWTSERDGYNHIYHYAKTGKLIKQVTTGKWDVTNFYGFDDKTGNIYYQSVEGGSINRNVYRINLKGKNKVQLSTAKGNNDATFSPDYSLYINSFSSATVPDTYTLNNAKDGSPVKEIVNNNALLAKLQAYNLPAKEFTTITTEKGHELNAWFIKPKDFDPAKKYPVLMYQYSGPGSQEVQNTWNSANDYWFYMLAQEGYIVACVDGRGTGYKGSAFKKVTYKELGKYEVEDQIDAAKVIAQYPYIDAARIGIWGWSYGGFMSSNCILKGADVFKMAIAVAPVTNWRFYDSVYTERYMQTPQENASGYDDNSPINHVKKLKGKYLLVHGSADDNVHLQNTMLMAEALIQANKQFDWAIYPDKNHGIYGGSTRMHLYTKMTNFIKDNL